MARATATPVKAPAKTVKKAAPKPPVTKAPAKRVPVKATPVKAVPATPPPGKAVEVSKAVDVVPPVKVEPIKALPIKHDPAELDASWGQLFDAVKRAAFTSHRVLLPVLAGMVFQCDHEGVVVARATDMEVFTETRLPKAFWQGGDGIVVNSRVLLDALKGIKGELSAAQANCEPISLFRHADGSTVLVGFGRSLRLDATPGPLEDYPKWPARPRKKVATLPSGAFVQGFGFAMTAAGKDETLPMLTAVHIDTTDNTFLLAATDRYRLSIIEVPAQDVEPFTILVPRQGWPVLKPMVGRVTLYLDASKDAGRLLVVSGDVSVSLRLSEATFPPFRTLLPEGGASWRVNRKQLIGDVTAAASATDGGNVPIHIAFSTGKYQVEGCEMHDADSGSKVSADWKTGFNPTFLLDGLGKLDSDEVSIVANSGTKPHVLVGDVGRHQATYLIMPVRLPG